VHGDEEKLALAIHIDLVREQMPRSVILQPIHASIEVAYEDKLFTAL